MKKQKSKKKKKKSKEELRAEREGRKAAEDFYADVYWGEV